MWRWIFTNCPNVFVFVAPCTLLLQVHMHNCMYVFSRIARLLYISSSVKWKQGWKCQHDTEFCDRTKNGKKQNEEWWRSSLAGNCDTMVMERIIFHTAYNWIADNAENYEDIGENAMNSDTHNVIQWRWYDNVTHLTMTWQCDSHDNDVTMWLTWWRRVSFPICRWPRSRVSNQVSALVKMEMMMVLEGLKMGLTTK